MRSVNCGKVAEEEDNDEEDDKISLLPDCILHQILSCIPTKEAVATCVLSKRWENLWPSVPSVDIDDSLLYSSQKDFQRPFDVTNFMNFVDKVLRLRDVSTMTRFRLSCRVCFNASKINEWILTAIKHNVQELHLCIFVEEPFALPSSVFSNAFLTVMKLELNCTLQLPTNISFPCLKTLHLCLVTFPSDHLMKGLFASCPSLEELAILDCEWMNLKSVTIAIPSLKILIIDDIPFSSVDNLKGCLIKIEARNLILFKYSGYFSNQIDVYELSSSALTLIHIPIRCGRQYEIAIRTIRFFKGLKNVSSLRISGGTIESLFLIDKAIDYLPIYENLTLLELRGMIGRHSIELLIKFLRCLPKLEVLHFSEGLGHSGDDCELNFAPNCTLPSLKTVNYHNLHGTNTEISLLKFVLENAFVLEKVNLLWSKKNSEEEPKNQEEIIDQLHALPRGSSRCTLVFE